LLAGVDICERFFGATGFDYAESRKPSSSAINARINTSSSTTRIRAVRGCSSD
jgi:hypothetical protein